jgi:hypothetical protein
MSTISSTLTAGLLSLSGYKSESLSYATSHGGSFTALTGFVIGQERVGAPIYDDANRCIGQRRTAYLKGPTTPLMATLYEVKDSLPTTPLIWAVEGVKIEQQQIVTLWREERFASGPDRGAVA